MDKYNKREVWSEEDRNAMNEIQQLRKDVAKARERLEKRDARLRMGHHEEKNSYYWAVELQKLTRRLNDKLRKFGPRIVK